MTTLRAARARRDTTAAVVSPQAETMGASHSNDPSVHRPPALARRTSSGYAVQPSKGGFCVPCGAASKSKKKPDAPAARRRSRGSSAGGVFSPSRTHPTVERLISDLRGARARFFAPPARVPLSPSPSSASLLRAQLAGFDSSLARRRRRPRGPGQGRGQHRGEKLVPVQGDHADAPGARPPAPHSQRGDGQREDGRVVVQARWVVLPFSVTLPPFFSV